MMYYYDGIVKKKRTIKANGLSLPIRDCVGGILPEIISQTEKGFLQGMHLVPLCYEGVFQKKNYIHFHC